MSHKNLKKRNRRQYKLIRQLSQNLKYLNEGYQIELVARVKAEEALAHSQTSASLSFRESETAWREVKALQEVLEITRRESSEFQLKAIEAENTSRTFQREVEALHDRAAEYDADAALAAKESELVQQAETIGRIAGNRMDALERFYNDLLAGAYDEPGSFPNPTILAEDVPDPSVGHDWPAEYHAPSGLDFDPPPAPTTPAAVEDFVAYYANQLREVLPNYAQAAAVLETAWWQLTRWAAE